MEVARLGRRLQVRLGEDVEPIDRLVSLFDDNSQARHELLSWLPVARRAIVRDNVTAIKTADQTLGTLLDTFA